MDWNDTPAQAVFRKDVHDFIEQRLPQYYKDAKQRRLLEDDFENDWQEDFANGSDEAKAAARDWAAALAERGWGAPHWPQEYGGAGLSTYEQFVLKQEFAISGAPVVGGAGVTLLGPTILIHGTEEQKQKYLEPTLRGEMLWAQGFSEPGAGSDLASLQCRAIRDGDEYVINGQKLWTSAGHKSNWIFILTRTDPEAPKHRGISFLLADMTSPGVSVRPIISMGFKHATNETFYEDVRVPVENRVGEENRGWYVAMTLLDFERSGISGAIQQQEALEDMVAHIKADATPHRADLLRREIADRWTEVEVGMNISLRIASMQANGLVPNYEASMGKLYSTELTQRIARTGTKVFGLYGNLWAHTEPYAPLGAQHTHTYCDSVVLTIAGGSNEIQRNIIATRGLGLPRG